MSQRRGLFLFVCAVFAFFIIRYHAVIPYLVVQGSGQLRVLLGSRDISAYRDDPSLCPETQEKLALVESLLEFAVKELGLTDNGSYRTLYDQQGEPLLWMVKAAPPFSLEPCRWDFPLLGSFSYISYFNRQSAQKRAEKLRKEGYDTWISPVSAWSTLGYFRDPVLSSMLELSEGRLARLIFHEMTHGTIFIRGNMQFNENIATFFGDYGALHYLQTRYGSESQKAREYSMWLEDSRLLNRHLVDGAHRLRALYASFDPRLPSAEKQRQKKLLIRRLMEEAASLNYAQKERYEHFREFTPNNAWLSGYLTYSEDLSLFEDAFTHTFNGSFADMITYYTARKR